MNADLTRAVKDLGHRAGFDLVRIARAEPLHEERDRYLKWLADGRAGGMRWMTAERAERSADPCSVLADARSVICVGIGYRRGSAPSRGPGEGRIARYAWGRDYHAVLGERLDSLVAGLTVRFGGSHRAYVDTGPLMDKALAVRAGLGWYGKHTNLITPEVGTYVLLGEIVTSLDLMPDQPRAASCGECRLCSTACPTGALADDYSIDARRCISYLTIEHRGPIPRELRPLLGSWVFGCDICQDVCPPAIAPYLANRHDRVEWTRSVRAMLARAEPDGTGDGEVVEAMRPPNRATVDLFWLLRLSRPEYLEAFRGTAIRRAKVWMLRRNAAVALGNVGEESASPALSECVLQDEEPIVRSHAAWALGRLAVRDVSDTRDILRRLRAAALPDDVAEEVQMALMEAEAAVQRRHAEMAGVRGGT